MADPGQIESKRAEAQQVLLEIRALDSRLEKSIEAYDAATGRLHEIQGDLRVNRFEFKVARRNLGAAQTQLAERLRAIYVSGQDGDSTLEILLGSRSLDDVVSSLDALDRVSSADATILRQVQQFRRDVKKHRTLLRRANERQKQVVAERASEKADIQAGLAERQQLLSSIQDEIARLQAEEAARQAELKREAEARLLQQQHQQRVSLQNAVVGPAAETPEATVAPPSQYGGVVGVAMQFLGTPYVWGGSSPGGFDCSGLVAYVYGQEGVSLPHNAAAQYSYGVPVSQGDLQPGDLVFFDGLGHVGIYIGGGQFIHSPHTGDVVKISSLSGWYAASYVGARRIVS